MTGRLYEVGLIAGYKLRTGHMLQDVGIAPTMFMKGLLNPFPHFIKNKAAIARMFEKTLNRKEGE
jgi:heterodisulfide reductase subunit C